MTAVAQGSLPQMSVLFDRYHKRIYNFLYQMVKDEAVCEDITQNVFYKAIKYKHSYRGGKFVSWIFKIARNNLADYFELQKRKQPNIAIEQLETPQEEGLEEEVAHLYQALDALATADKELIVLSKIQGISYEDIAQMTDSSTGAVKVKTHRILKKLRTLYFETC